jgi:hypothetical protein
MRLLPVLKDKEVMEVGMRRVVVAVGMAVVVAVYQLEMLVLAVRDLHT